MSTPRAAIPGLAPHIPLAIAIHNRPGTYALLLGSGISTSAKIPTGWQVVERLCLDVAATEHAAPDKPAEWFEGRYGAEPTYSGLIEALGLSAPERQAMVVNALTSDTGVFPPPTPAHHAIAALAAGGWIKVILTTNFDPLLEDALRQAGVDFTVLASADQIRGAVPLAHAGVVIVKLHGDYKDLGIRNTESELSAYEDALDTLLDRVFDDYGLIVCGWSADSDHALRAAMERSPNRRFQTYWTARGGHLRPDAQELAARRDAEVISITGADAFFGQMRDAVESLRDLSYEPADSPALAVASLKRDLAGRPTAISAHDRVRRQVTRAREFADGLDAHRDSGEVELRKRTGDIEMLAAVIATIAYWGNTATDSWWVDEIGQFTRRTGNGGNTSVLDLPKVPGLVMVWAGGIAAIASGRDDLLARLVALPPAKAPWDDELIHPVTQLDLDVLYVAERNGWMYHRLRPVFVESLALGAAAYADAFDRWQYTLAVFARFAGDAHSFRIRRLLVDGYNPMRPVSQRWFEATLRKGDAHPLVASGITGHTDDTAVELLRAASEAVANDYGPFARDTDFGQLRGSSGGILPSSRHYPGSHTDNADAYFTDPTPGPL